VFEGVQSAHELSESYTPLFPAVELSLPRAEVFSNLDTFDAKFHDHHQFNVFPGRVAKTTEIGLVTLPEGSTVVRMSGYLTTTPGGIVKEQIHPRLMTNEEEFWNAVNGASDPVHVDKECLLVARFGEATWGHWLGEILPRAIIAEAFFPGRFCFAVPDWTTKEGSNSTFLQSLLAYGITESRLVRLISSNCYRFRSLSTVTPVRSDRAMHPQVLELMRKNVVVKPDAFGRYLPSRLALLRKDIGRRSISNYEEVEVILKARGFLLTESSENSFEAQVSLFRAAHEVFCVLGSGLTNVIFSPEYVNVIAPAPEAWGDSFFYPLVQARNGKFADIRGPRDETYQNLAPDFPFSVPVDQLETALNLMGVF